MIRSKKIKILLCAFLIPILIIGIHLIYMEIINPGYFAKGENLLLADMSSQYNSLYSYIQDVFLGKASIFYSFSKSLGGNMASTIGYYLGSPFNILYVFFSKASIPLCTFIIYLLKIGLTGLFMNFYLSKKQNSYSYTTLIFSTFYALCSYTVNYYFNNMWLDVVLLTPLVLYGIDYIIEKRKIYLYTIFLSMAIISNFYIAYMLCIFTVIYFLFELFTRFKSINNKKDVIIKYIIGSLLAGGISCILLLPAITNLAQIMRSPIDSYQLKYDTRGLKNTIFNDILSKLLIGSHSKESSLSRNRPNIYFGILPLILCYYYYFNHKFKIKEKIITFLITFMFLLSLFLPRLNLVWHGFSVPNGYICRFSFLFIFFMIYIAFKTFNNLEKIKIIPSIIFILVYSSISYYISTQYLVFLEKKDIIISVLFMLIYLILLFIISRVNKIKNILKVILIFIVIIEVYINFSDSLITNQKMKIISSYSNFYYDVCPKINNLDNDFYRVDGNYYYSYLDSMICRTNSLTSSLSTNDGNLYKTLYDYGYSLTYTTVTEDENKLPIMDSLLGVKYYYAKEKFDDSYYKYINSIYTKKYNYVYKMWKDKELFLYENPYALKLGFLVDENYFQNYNKDSNNNFEKLNNTMKSFVGNDKDILHKYASTYNQSNNYIFNIDNDSKYLYLSYNYKLAINWTTYESIYINNEYVATGTSDDIGTIKIPNKYANSDINLTIRYDNYSNQENNISDLVMYSFDIKQFEDDINILKKYQVNNIKIDKNKVKMNVDVNDNKNILFLSIPYDKGWNIYVDGRKVKYYKIADDFIGVKLSKGKHSVSMKYCSPNFKLGLCISVLSICLLIIYEKKCKKN